LLKRWTSAVRVANGCCITCLALYEDKVKEETVDGTTDLKDREICRIHEYIE